MDNETPRRGSPQLAVVNNQRSADAPRSEPEPASMTDTPGPSQPPRSGAPGREPAPSAGAQPGTLRVCVVDDSYSTLRAIFRVLKERGHEVDHFSQPEDAVAALRRGGYHALVMSDSIVGGAAACDATIARLRQSPDATLAGLPVLALTAVDSAARRGALRAAGASAVLVGFSEERFHNALLGVVAQRSTGVDPSTPRRVCLVEDSYSLSLVLSDALTRAGHEVEHFAMAAEALAAMRARRYDFLVTGQNDARSDIPCASFVEQARSLSRSQGVGLPVLVLTSDASPVNVQALRRSGADRILTKNAANLERHVLALVARGLAPAESARPQRTTATQVPPAPGPAAPPVAEAPPSAPLRQTPALLPPPRAAAAAPSPPPQPAAKRVLPIGTTFKPWWGAAVVAVAVLAGWLLWQFAAERTAVEVVAAKLGTVARTVAVSGHVVSKRQVDLPPPQSGQIYRVFADEGNLVRKGESLATLDNREAIINVRRAEAQVYRYRTEIEMAGKALKQWRAQKGQGISQQVLLDLESSKALSEAKLRVAEQDVKAAQLAVDRLAIEAPFAGMITQSFAIEGKWVDPSTPLFTLADIDSWEVAVRVSGAEARSIVAGQTVHLSTEGLEREEWKEKVLRVAGGASQGSDPGAAQSEAVVYISLGDEAPAIEFGERVLAQVVTESASNTVTVPYETVIERDGKSYVAVVDSGRVVYRPVEVGVRALTHLEIVNGLAPGDQVILPRAPVAEGQRVEVTAVAEGVGADVEDYPHREAFPDVAVLSTDELRKRYDQARIVDVRSKFEYNVVHITNAVNVPLSEASFLADLERVRAKGGDEALVFYCNGHSCSKSYEAVRKAASGGFMNLYAYDGGIFDWMREQREHTTLVGETPAPLRKMVSEDYFQGRLVSFDAFKRKAEAKDTVVLDVRDTLQRTSSIPLPATAMPLDEFVAKLDGKEFRGRQLLIFDAVGKQVRWLQYVLEDKGYKDYFFLRDGAAALEG